MLPFGEDGISLASVTFAGADYEAIFIHTRDFLLRGVMTGVLSGVTLGGITGALVERKPKVELSFDADDESVYDEKLIGEGVAK